MSEHVAELVKQSLRSSSLAVRESQLEYVIGRVVKNKLRKKRGWKFVGPLKIGENRQGEQIIYKSALRFKRAGVQTGNEASEWQNILAVIEKAAEAHRWQFDDPNNPIADLPENADKAPVKELKIAELVWQNKSCQILSGLFAREEQIKLCMQAVDAAIMSKMKHRFHTVLFGPPGCGKTSILAGIREMLGNDAVMRFDATSLTKAGAERELLGANQVPPVLMIEELEKSDETALRWLLGLMDDRGEVRKTNFRIGTIAKSVPMLVLATVNNISVFRRMMEGALASRFVHHVFCPRPSAEVLSLICEREIEQCGGNKEWIAPAVKYCTETESNNDPRRVIAVMLTGKDDLLDGSFQRRLMAVREC